MWVNQSVTYVGELYPFMMFFVPLRLCVYYYPKRLLAKGKIQTQRLKGTKIVQHYLKLPMVVVTEIKQYQ